jgi:acyl transferase domain-containing protein
MQTNPSDPSIGPTETSIAVIGMSCTFPGARSLEEFWHNIVYKTDCLTEMSEPRFRRNSSHRSGLGTGNAAPSRRGGWIGDDFAFNPLRHETIPVAIRSADPDHFLILRAVYEAMSDAGYLEVKTDRVSASVILGKGNYCGVGTAALMYRSIVTADILDALRGFIPQLSDEDLNTLSQAMIAEIPVATAEAAAGLISNVCVGRAATRLDLMGRAFTVDAACASSLIAIELGVQDLLRGATNLVLAGGVHLSTDFDIEVFDVMKALSPTSIPRPYDAEADGIVLGEGIGILVLKRLTDAERDHDRVYAVIKGVGSSSDGRARSVLAPRIEGQELAMRRAYEMTRFSPRTVQLIEGHGTATQVGDSTEIASLHRVFGPAERGRPGCALGSVKSMIGHAMPAAGAAGLIKAILSLYHEVFPPTINCGRPHAALTSKDSWFYPNTEARPWIRAADAPRRAGVNAFGFGGVNSHVVVQEYPNRPLARPTTLLRTWDTEAIVLSGSCRKALHAEVHRLSGYITKAKGITLRDLAYTCNSSVNSSEHRLSIVASSITDLKAKLDRASATLANPTQLNIRDRQGIYYFGQSEICNGKVALMFPGDGSQYVNMFRELSLHFPEFRMAFAPSESEYVSPDDQAAECSLGDIVFPPPFVSSEQEIEANARLSSIDNASLCLIASENAVRSLFENLKLQPDMVVGHSCGAWMAMVAAGVVSPEVFRKRMKRVLTDMYRVLAKDSTFRPMTTLAIGGRRNQIEEVLQRLGPQMLASDNCPHQVVIAVDACAEVDVTARFKERGLIVQKLLFDRGYHTPAFRRSCEQLRECLSSLQISAPRIPLYSCATAALYTNEPGEIPGLVVDAFAKPVLFRDTIEAMYEAGARTFVEAGPGTKASGFVSDILRGRPHLAVSIDQSSYSGTASLNHAIAMLAAAHVTLDLTYIYSPRSPRQLSLDVEKDRFPDPDDEPGTIRISTCWPRLTPPSEVARLAKRMSADSPFPVGLIKDKEICQPIAQDRQPNTEDPKDYAPETVLQQHFSLMQNFLTTHETVLMHFLNRSMSRHSDASSYKAADTSLVFERASTASGSTDVPNVAPTEPAETRDLSGPQQPSLVDMFLEIFSDLTGYPGQALNLDLDLESDLGVDSLKRVEILMAFEEVLANDPRLTQRLIDGMNACKTLREVAAVLQKE